MGSKTGRCHSGRLCETAEQTPCKHVLSKQQMTSISQCAVPVICQRVRVQLCKQGARPRGAHLRMESSSSRSSMLRAMGPAWSRVKLAGTIPSLKLHTNEPIVSRGSVYL